jgi:hypothetical protein
MRISIREQLGLLVLVCSLMALMVLALATVREMSNWERCTVLTAAVVPKQEFYYRHKVRHDFMV